MISNRQIALEDFEKEAEKDQIYIQEEYMLKEQEFYQYLRNREAVIEAQDEEGNPIEVLKEYKLPF